ncbi:lipopolysaccharide biosynthesis protein [Silvimonas amylolytica]|uniref:Membrane protein involved in the export of O-antigen and teichoic acid n=1 Tax=Silvimonas amylolytica TaxID=449663 RepID=A0ABQ2PJL1_9NEIS|nr:oligosaccharide flippase family protein [Silvimonas amylolytica]GGP25538.1 hypothetical protein GCM10010971_13570 [Silvimonas amylolytica]
MLGRSVSIQFLSNVLAGGISFLFTMWVARVSGPGAFADYSFYFSIGSIAAVLMDGGYHKVLLRDSGQPRQAILSAQQLAAAASGHASLVLVIALGLAALLGKQSAAGIGIALVYFFLFIQGQFVSSMLRGQSRFSLESGWSALLRVSAVVVPVLAWYKLRIGTPEFLLGWSAAGFLFALLLMVRPLDATGLLRPRLMLGLALTALPYLLMDLAAMANFRTDVMVLKLLHADPQQAGHYLAAARVYEALVYLPAGPLFVLTVRLRERSDLESTAFLKVITIGVALAAIIACVIGLIAPVLVPLLSGAEYQASSDYLRVLLLGLLFQYPALLMLAIGVAGERTWRYVLILYASVLINGLAGVALVGHIGVMGVAWANVIAQAVLAIGFFAAFLIQARSGQHA